MRPGVVEPGATTTTGIARPDAPGVRAGSFAARSLCAWVLGVVGPVAAIRGWGPVVMSHPVQARSIPLILVSTGLFVATSPWWRRSTSVTWAARVVVVLVSALLTASTAGRAPGAIAALAVVVALAALLPERPDPRRVCRSASSLAVLLAAQALWIRDAGIAPSTVLLVAALVVSAGWPARPPTLTELTGARAAIDRRMMRAAHRAASAARGFRGALAATIRSSRDARRNLLLVGACAAGAGALMAPVFYRYASRPADVLGFADYEVHLDVASRVGFLPPRIPAPHPLFHVGVALFAGPLGQEWATSLLLGVAVALTFVVMFRLASVDFAGRPGLGVALSLAFAAGQLVVESPSMLASALHIGDVNDWAPTNHMFLSPTDTLLVPLAVIVVVLLSRAFSSSDATPTDLGAAAPLSRSQGVLLALASMTAMLAKPSMNMALLVAVPALLVITGRIRTRLTVFLLAWFVTPSVVVLLWQTWFIETGAAGLPEAGIAIRPFETIRMVGLDQVGPLLFLAALVVPLCLCVGPRRYLREPMVALSLLSMAASLVILVLFNETGARAGDGTFTKPAFISWAVLNVVSWRFLLGEAAHGEGAAGWRARRRAWWLPAGVLVAVSTVAGVLTYLEAIGALRLATRPGTG